MEGHWADAPNALIKNVKKLERFVLILVIIPASIMVPIRTLESISVCMTKEAEHKWHNRLLRKSSIEASIVEFNAELDDAVRSFQVGLTGILPQSRS